MKLKLLMLTDTSIKLRLLIRSTVYHLKRMKLVWQTDKYFPPKFRKRINNEINIRLKSGKGPSIWFLPTQTWFCSAFQRPQQMARALADIGCTVIYYEPWSDDDPAITNEGLKERQFVGVRDLAPHLHLLRCPESLILEYISRNQPDVLLMLWPHQAGLIPPNSSSFVVYEVIDDPELIKNATDSWYKVHWKWISNADVVVATADDLLNQLFSKRPDALLLPNGVCIDDWILTEPNNVPEDMIAPCRASAVVGYYGSIAEWFDWEMWEFAAKTKPDWAFVLIGPPFDQDFEKIIERTRHYKNMYYLGSKSYNSLADYLVNFDVATIPFVINKITNACSPIKLFEYMAARKPIVATPMQEILKYKSVLIAENPEAFVNQLEKALIIKDDPEYRSMLKREAEANTWRSRAEKLREAIETARHHQNNIPRHFMKL